MGAKCELIGGRGQFIEGGMVEVAGQEGAEQDGLRFQAALRALTARLQDVREEERTSIARELHDELGKDLTLLTLDLAWLRDRLVKCAPEGACEPLREKIVSMEQTVQATLQTVRRILSDLRPPLLDELGLKDAIDFHIQEFAKRAGIRYEFSASIVSVLSEKVGIAVFRILQELLTNVARHAKASRIKVEIVESDSVLLLMVEDNGRGIHLDGSTKAKGLGILGICERAWSIGGAVEIQRTPQPGTRVTLRVPLNPPSSNDCTVECDGAAGLNRSLPNEGAVAPSAGVPQSEFRFDNARGCSQ